MKEMSLFDELIECLSSHGKTWDDVIHVYGYSYRIYKDNFKDLASAEYGVYGVDDYYTKVARDLKLKGGGFIIARVRYKWVYIELPETPVLDKSDIPYWDELLLTLGENHSRPNRFVYGNAEVMCNDTELVFLLTDDRDITEWHYMVYSIPDRITDVDRITSREPEDMEELLKELQITDVKFSIEALYGGGVREYMECFERGFSECFATAIRRYSDVFIKNGRKLILTDMSTGKSITITNTEE